MKSDLFRGRYLFHFHTILTDGKLSTREYFEFAALHGADRLIFLEHIRRKPTYDVDAFLTTINRLAEETKLEASIGFETKLLPGGELDIDAEYLEKAEVIGIAEHGFPADAELLKLSFLRSLDRYVRLLPKKSFVWVHPGLWLQKQGHNPEESRSYHDMLDCALSAGILIERNLRYRLICDQTLSRISAESIVLGADAHTVRDLQIWKCAQRSFFEFEQQAVPQAREKPGAIPLLEPTIHSTLQCKEKKQ